MARAAVDGCGAYAGRRRRSLGRARPTQRRTRGDPAATRRATRSGGGAGRRMAPRNRALPGSLGTFRLRLSLRITTRRQAVQRGGRPDQAGRWVPHLKVRHWLCGSAKGRRRSDWVSWGLTIVIGCFSTTHFSDKLISSSICQKVQR